jgi:hypothetical protein
MTRSHSFKKVYSYVGASINLVIKCDWAGRFDAVAQNKSYSVVEGEAPELTPLTLDSCTLTGPAAVAIDATPGTEAGCDQPDPLTGLFTLDQSACEDSGVGGTWTQDAVAATPMSCNDYGNTLDLADFPPHEGNEALYGSGGVHENQTPYEAFEAACVALSSESPNPDEATCIARHIAGTPAIYTAGSCSNTFFLTSLDCNDSGANWDAPSCDNLNAGDFNPNSHGEADCTILYSTESVSGEFTAGTALSDAQLREPESYRKALAPVYNDQGAKTDNLYANHDHEANRHLSLGSGTVNDRWGTILDSLIHGVMQLISVGQNPQKMLQATLDNLATDFEAAANTFNTVVNTAELDFNKVRSSLAYQADIWQEAGDESKRNRLKEKEGVNGYPGVDTSDESLKYADQQSATPADSLQSNEVNKSNLGMLVNNTNVKQVLNAMAIDGCFKFSFSDANVADTKHMAPAAITEFNSVVRENLALSDLQRAQRIIDMNDKMIFPCDLKTLHYSTSTTDAPAYDNTTATGTDHTANNAAVVASGMEGDASSKLAEPASLNQGSASSSSPSGDGSSDSQAVDQLMNDDGVDNADAYDKTQAYRNAKLGMYQLAIANQITYDVNIVFQQSKRTDGTEGHDGMVSQEEVNTEDLSEHDATAVLGAADGTNDSSTVPIPVAASTSAACFQFGEEVSGIANHAACVALNSCNNLRSSATATEAVDNAESSTCTYNNYVFTPTTDPEQGPTDGVNKIGYQESECNSVDVEATWTAAYCEADGVQVEAETEAICGDLGVEHSWVLGSCSFGKPTLAAYLDTSLLSTGTPAEAEEFCNSFASMSPVWAPLQTSCNNSYQVLDPASYVNFGDFEAACNALFSDTIPSSESACTALNKVEAADAVAGSCTEATGGVAVVAADEDACHADNAGNLWTEGTDAIPAVSAEWSVAEWR